MTKSKLPLKTILFSFLVILSAKKSSNDDPGSESSALASPANHTQAKPILVKPELGVLVAKNNVTPAVNSTHEFCILQYNSDHLPDTQESMKYYPISDKSRALDQLTDLCVPLDDRETKEITDSVVLLKFSQITRCNISVQAKDLESRGAAGLLIEIPNSSRIKEIQVVVNATASQSFIMAVIFERSVDAMRRFYTPDLNGTIPSSVQVGVFSPRIKPSISYSFDLSLLVIWLIAVFTLVVGCYWSGLVRFALYEKKRNELARSLSDSSQGEYPHSERKKSAAQTEEEQFLSISPCHVILFVACMAGMLVALYTFFNYLVLFIIALFVMATTLSVSVCCDPIARWILPASLIAVKIPCFSKRCKVPLYQLFVLAFATSLSLTWFFTRKKSYSWILQDILGVFFSINMLRTIRLPSFKICVILLTLLFFYDIFFVFLTPLLTRTGDSVMVEVATGGSGKDEGSSGSDDDSESGRETLPMVLRVPHLSIAGTNESDPLEVCYSDLRKSSHSLLGFGDILVPGLLVSYCHAFDLINRTRGRPYFVTTAIFYALGLIVTFVGLYLMSGVAQPALLYLVPMTLIPPAIIAYFRGELRAFWVGPGDGSTNETQCHDQDDDEDEESVGNHRSTETSSNSSSPASHIVTTGIRQPTANITTASVSRPQL